MTRRVVITGLGPIVANGIGKTDFWSNILKQNFLARSIPDAYNRKYNFKSRFYVPAPKLDLAEYGFAESLERIMEEMSKYSVVGAKLALMDAGFTINVKDKAFEVEGIEDSAIIMGIGMSSIQTALHSYVAHIADDNCTSCEAGNGPYKFNRMIIPMMMTSSAAAWISILFGIKGVCYTVNAACASGSIAIGEAFNKIKDGYCDTAITGGVEVLAEENGAIMRGFDMLTTLTRTEDGRPMPFSKKRSGFLFNEGAGCVMVLEELEHAKDRGANIYAEIVGFACNSDAHNIAQMEPSGKQVVSLYNKIVQNRKIDYINAHGTGTILNDDTEAKAIQSVFGDKDQQPFINSTKGIVGHSIGASGAIEAAVTALSIRDSVIHGNILDNPIDNLNLVTCTMNKNIDYAVSTSFGFGGHNAALLLKKYD